MHPIARAIIFDMDGVLVDSYRAHYDSWLATARTRGLSMTEESFAKTFGRTSRDIIRTLWGDHFSDADVHQFDLDKEAAYRDILKANFPAMPGAAACLQRLHAAGFKLAVGSSGPPENVALCLQQLGPAGLLFGATVTGSEVTRGKPDPQVFLLAAAKLHVQPEHCAVIEDAPAGLQAAANANMTPIALASGTAPVSVLTPLADHVAHSLDELTPDLLANLIPSDPTSA